MSSLTVIPYFRERERDAGGEGVGWPQSKEGRKEGRQASRQGQDPDERARANTNTVPRVTSLASCDEIWLQKASTVMPCLN